MFGGKWQNILFSIITVFKVMICIVIISLLLGDNVHYFTFCLV